MFTSIDKALIALVMAALYFVQKFTGMTFGIGEDAIASIIAVITPLLVYLIPNKSVSQ